MGSAGWFARDGVEILHDALEVAHLVVELLGAVRVLGGLKQGQESVSREDRKRSGRYKYNR